MSLGQFMPAARVSDIGPNILQALERAGGASNSRIALDAGGSRAVNSSATRWYNLADDPNGDFYRGDSVGTATTQPFFYGTPGDMTADESWTMGTGRRFDLVVGNSANFTRDLHKDGAQFTLGAWVKFQSTTTTQAICGNSGSNATGAGILFQMSSAGVLQFACFRATAGSFALNISGPSITASMWSFCTISVDEPAGVFVFGINGTYQSFSRTYTSPTATNPTYTFQLGAKGNTVDTMRDGAQMACFFGVAEPLTNNQLTDVFNKTRGRFGV